MIMKNKEDKSKYDFKVSVIHSTLINIFLNRLDKDYKKLKKIA